MGFRYTTIEQYSFTSHYRFQSCSLAFAASMMEAFGYDLVAVGGTKDALFCHNSTMEHIKRIDTKKASYAFGRHALETISKKSVKCSTVPSAMSPSAWYAVDPSRITKEVVAAVVEAACKARAKEAHKTDKTVNSCPFPYVLYDSPSQALAEFTRTMKQS